MKYPGTIPVTVDKSHITVLGEKQPGAGGAATLTGKGEGPQPTGEIPHPGETRPERPPKPKKPRKRNRYHQVPETTCGLQEGRVLPGMI